MKKFNLSGKNAVVTGGGSGIGRAIAMVLAGHGAKVNILDFDPEAGRKVATEIEEKGGKADSYACDVSDTNSVNKAFEEVAQSGQLDILVNNAGIAHVGNVESTEPEDMDRLYQVNVKGVYHCLKAGVTLMKESGGSIINLSSIAAHVGLKDRFAYSMTKGAVHTMSMSVAKDYVDTGIRCNCIAPARVHTPFVDGFISANYPGQEKKMFENLSKTQPIGRMGKPEEIADLVLYLASDEASFITGSSFPIDGGFINLNS